MVQHPSQFTSKLDHIMSSALLALYICYSNTPVFYYVRFIILFQDAQEVPASSSISHSNPEARSDSSYVIFVLLPVCRHILFCWLYYSICSEFYAGVQFCIGLCS